MRTTPRSEPPPVPAATATTPASVGPTHGTQPSPNTAPSRGAPQIPAARHPVHPALALQQRDQPGERQPHHDHDDPAGALQQRLVAHQRVGQPDDPDQDRAEHDREPGDEQRRRPGDPPPTRARRARLVAVAGGASAPTSPAR